MVFEEKSREYNNIDVRITISTYKLREILKNSYLTYSVLSYLEKRVNIDTKYKFINFTVILKNEGNHP